MNNKNLTDSILQILNVAITTALSFVVVFTYLNALSPTDFGKLVTSQAEVLFWIVLVDFGLTFGILSVSNEVEKKGQNIEETIKNLLLFRVLMALLSVILLVFVSVFSQQKDFSLSLTLCYVPSLFAHAFHYTLSSYYIYKNRLAFYITSNLFSQLIFSLFLVFLVKKQVSISVLLFTHSMIGFFSCFLMLIFDFDSTKKIIFLGKVSIQKTLQEIKKHWNLIWPNTIALLAITVWNRLDQIAVSHMINYETGGIFAFSEKIAFLLVILAHSLGYAFLPKLQKKYRNSSEFLPALRMLSKFSFIFGPLIIFAFYAFVVISFKLFFPHKLTSLSYFKYFLPGVWIYWVAQPYLLGLLASTQEKAYAVIQLWSVFIYGICIFVFVALFEAKGAALASIVFCALMLVAAKHKLDPSTSWKNTYFTLHKNDWVRIKHFFNFSEK